MISSSSLTGVDTLKPLYFVVGPVVAFVSVDTSMDAGIDTAWTLSRRSRAQQGEKRGLA